MSELRCGQHLPRFILTAVCQLRRPKSE